MRAAAERVVRRGVGAVEDELVGVRVHRLVPVRRGEAQHHARVFFDDRARLLDRVHAGLGLDEHRWVAPERLFDRHRDHRGVGAHAGEVVGRRQQVLQQVAEQIGGRLVPGDDEVHHGDADLGVAEDVAFRIRLRHPRDEVVPRVEPAFGDQAVDVGRRTRDARRAGPRPARCG